MAIKAVVFDFDGTLLDTETCAFQAFCSIYEEHGHELSLDDWALCIGTYGAFDPYADLEQKLGCAIDRQAVRAQYEKNNTSRIDTLALLPGVIERLEEAQKLGLKLAIASSSDRAWLDKYTKQFGIRDYFSIICSSNDVEKVKPDPALYKLAVEQLGVEPHEAVAIEDSLNGLRAAQAAGLHSIVVPNEVTKQMTFEGATMRAESLVQVSLADFIARYQ